MPKGIYKRTEKQKIRLRKLSKKYGYQKGKKLTEEHKRKVGRKGFKHYNWKGGKILSYEGYVMIHMPEHPASHLNYISEHRLIIEKQMGRYLLSKEIGHHRNGIKDDNRPKNLMAFTSESAHKRFEWGGKVKSSEIIFDGRKMVSL